MIDIDKQLENIVSQASDYWGNGEFEACKEKLLEAWETLPSPKKEHPESFHIASYLIQISTELKDYKSAVEYATTLQTCDLKRLDVDNRLFLLGKAHYKNGNVTKAKELFLIANRLSNGKIFNEEDKKYKELIQDCIQPELSFEQLLEKINNTFSEKKYNESLNYCFDSLNCDEGLISGFIHLRKGQNHFELNELTLAIDELTRAYMLDTEDIFKTEDPKYLLFLMEHIKDLSENKT